MTTDTKPRYPMPGSRFRLGGDGYFVKEVRQFHGGCTLKLSHTQGGAVFGDGPDADDVTFCSLVDCEDGATVWIDGNEYGYCRPHAIEALSGSTPAPAAEPWADTTDPWFFERWRECVAKQPEWKLTDLHGNSHAAVAARQVLDHVATSKPREATEQS